MQHFKPDKMFMLHEAISVRQALNPRVTWQKSLGFCEPFLLPFTVIS